jgi:hypothetical protein
VALVCLSASCAAGGAGHADPGAALGLCEIARVPLTIADGSHPYVEAQSLVRVRSGFIVAGLPTYTWAPGRATERVTANEHMAAQFSLDGGATLIEKPIPGAVERVRAVALVGERWGALFAEILPDSTRVRQEILHLWYAEHDGQRWVSLEELDVPEGEAPDLWGGTELVWTGESVVWVAPLRPGPGAVLYERRGGAWSHELISDAQIEVSALAHHPSMGLLWAHFSEDPGLPGWQQSLRLYRRGASWELVTRVLVASEGMKVRSPTIMPVGDGVTVSWLLGDGGAYALVGIGPGGERTPVDLDPDASRVLPFAPADQEPLWLIAHADPGSQERGLELLAPGSPFGPRRVGSLPSPFVLSHTAAVVSPTELVVVGPQYDPDPANGFLRSLILRLSTSCT